MRFLPLPAAKKSLIKLTMRDAPHHLLSLSLLHENRPNRKISGQHFPMYTLQEDMMYGRIFFNTGMGWISFPSASLRFGSGQNTFYRSIRIRVNFLTNSDQRWIFPGQKKNTGKYSG